MMRSARAEIVHLSELGTSEASAMFVGNSFGGVRSRGNKAPVNWRGATLVPGVGRSTFAQLTQCGLKPAGELLGWTGTPIVEEEDRRLSAGHVIVDRDNVQTIGPEGFQNGCD